MSEHALADRAVACLAGAAVGDALGGATEGWEAHEIQDHFGGFVEGIVESIRRTKKVEKAFSPFHKGDGHVTDDTLMTHVLVRAYDVKRDHLDAYDVEELMLPEIVDRAMWIPELQREDLLYHRLFLAEKWLVLKLRYGHADPRDAGIGNLVNCGAAMYIAPVGIANSGDARGAQCEALDLTGAHQSSYGRDAAVVLAAAVAEAMRPDAVVADVVDVALRLAKDATRSAIEAVVETAAELDGWRSGGLAELRRAFAPFDSVGEAYAAPAQNARTPSRLHAIEELPIALGLARRDRRRLRRDGARRRQLRARLGLDRLDGRGARRSARRDLRAPAGLGRRGVEREPHRRRGSGQDDGLCRGRDLRARRPPARATCASCARADGDGRRGARLRVTWSQPEDLIGHELRQAREEGQDVDAVEQRWFAAGGAPAPGRGASQEPVPDELRALALVLLDELDARPRPLSEEEPGGLDEILAAAAPAAARRAGDLEDRIAGAWLGRAAGCVLGKPVESIPREGIRAIAQATGQLAGRGLVHRRGARGGGLGAVAVEPREPSHQPGGEHRRDPRGRRSQLHHARRRAPRAVRDGLRCAGRRQGLARLHAARPDLHGRARRDPQPARGLPSAGDGHTAQPVPRVDRGATSGRCLRLGGGGRSGRRRSDGVGGRPRQPHRERRLRGDVHGGRARSVPFGVVSGGVRRHRPLGRPGREAGSPKPCGRRATWKATGKSSSTGSTSATAHYHWVHAINNTALVAAALYRFDGDFSGAISAVVQGGWDTDTNGAAVGSILGATVGASGIDDRWAAPLQGRFASSLPGFDGITLDELVQRTLAVVPAAV